MDQNTIEGFYHVFNYILHNQGKWEPNLKIQSCLSRIKQKYDIDTIEILHMLIEGFIRLKHYNKVTDSSDYTFCLNYVKNNLRNIERKLERLERTPERKDLHMNKIPYNRTPEQDCIVNDIYNKTMDFFSRDETEVLLGKKSVKEKAEELGVTYSSFVKRLYRKKKHSFITQLKKLFLEEEL